MPSFVSCCRFCEGVEGLLNFLMSLVSFHNLFVGQVSGDGRFVFAVTNLPFIFLRSQSFEENTCNINKQICSLPIHPKVLVCISSLRILLETMPSYIMWFEYLTMLRLVGFLIFLCSFLWTIFSVQCSVLSLR